VSRGRLICILGPDGSGKTTLAAGLARRFEENDVRVRLIWFRFQHFFVLPILALCRVMGLTEYVHADGYRFGVWRFYRSRLLRKATPIAMLADAWLFSMIRVRLRLMLGETLVCDRYVYDTLVDLMLGTREPEMDRSLVGRCFLRLVPRNAEVFVVDAPAETIIQRRPVMALDLTLEERRWSYQALADRHGLTVIDNSGSRQASLSQLLHCVGLGLEPHPASEAPVG